MTKTKDICLYVNINSNGNVGKAQKHIYSQIKDEKLAAKNNLKEIVKISSERLHKAKLVVEEALNLGMFLPEANTNKASNKNLAKFGNKPFAAGGGGKRSFQEIGVSRSFAMHTCREQEPLFQSTSQH